MNNYRTLSHLSLFFSTSLSENGKALLIVPPFLFFLFQLNPRRVPDHPFFFSPPNTGGLSPLVLLGSCQALGRRIRHRRHFLPFLSLFPAPLNRHCSTKFSLFFCEQDSRLKIPLPLPEWVKDMKRVASHFPPLPPPSSRRGSIHRLPLFFFFFRIQDSPSFSSPQRRRVPLPPPFSLGTSEKDPPINFSPPPSPRLTYDIADHSLAVNCLRNNGLQNNSEFCLPLSP